MKKSVLISACLMGYKCRYNGTDCKLKDIEKLRKVYNLVPVCPEILGGLKTPRESIEIDHGRAYDRYGNDFTSYFLDGAVKTLNIVSRNGIDTAILKSLSPSCGLGLIYDGTFSGNKNKGNGYTAKLLKDTGIIVYQDTEVNKLL